MDLENALNDIAESHPISRLKGRPWLAGEWVYAANRALIVRVSADGLSFAENEKAPKLVPPEYMWDHHAVPAWTRWTPDLTPDAVASDYRRLYCIGNRYFARRLLLLAANVRDGRIEIESDPGDMARIRFTGGLGYIMACRQEEGER